MQPKSLSYGIQSIEEDKDQELIQSGTTPKVKVIAEGQSSGISLWAAFFPISEVTGLILKESTKRFT